ncbi:MAG TPA: O-antigen ligase family protein [Anaerolineaceae bacterium]|nr:O-antigen ligase family protein [Anaerolineaceae bacterium]
MVNRVLRLLDKVHPWVWAAGILLLPITSMPLVSRLVHSDMVAAPSALPFAWLLGLWFLPFLLKRGRLSRVSLPLLGFVLVAIAASAAAYFIDIPPLKQRSVLSRETQALLTLAVGVTFYLVTSAWVNTPERLRRTLQLINFAGLAMLLWCGVQAVAFLTNDGYYPEILHRIQQYISVSGLLYYKRVTGFAFEPSWLAHQLNMLWLPLWVSATIQRTSVHRFRLLGISFENILLAGGLATLFLSFSRVGMLAFMVVVAYLVLLLNLALARRLHAWIQNRFTVRPSMQRLLGRLISLGLLVVFVAVYLGAAYGVVKVGSRYDRRLAKIFETPQETIFSFQYANQLAFAERTVFWATGWSIFNDHPWIGVGLGNAGYFFDEHLPAFAWALPEVRTLMYRATYLPNTKSLWTRLLSETGLLGFALFAAWLFVIWQSAHTLRSSRNPLDRTVGMAGVITVVSLVVEGFSIDSFALPYLWISMGLVTATIQTKFQSKAGSEIEAQVAETLAMKG